MDSHFQFFWAEILRIEGYDRLVVKSWWICLPIVALMVLLACWRLVVLLVLWWQKPRSNPNGLFRQLARIHGLTPFERCLVSKLQPTLPPGAPLAILFADPSSWAWKKVTDPKVLEPLEKLYLKIFGFPREHEGN